MRGALKLRGASGADEDVAVDLSRFMEIYGARLTAITRPYPGVRETLNLLHGEGWRMGVCTNKREAFARAIVDDLELSEFFSIVSGPDTFGVSKPDPRQLLETAKAAGGYSPVFFVGDSEVDVASAQAAGYPVIALTYGYSKVPLESLSPDALLSDFTEVPGAIGVLLNTSA